MSAKSLHTISRLRYEEDSSANLRACVSYKVLPESALRLHCVQAPFQQPQMLSFYLPDPS